MRRILVSLSWLGPKGRAALVISLILVVVGGTGWFLFQDRLKKRISYWRADRLLEEAQESADRSNWKETFESAWESQELRRSYAATRLIFKSLRQMRDSSLLEFAVVLFHHKKATPADRLDVIEATLAVNDVLTTEILAAQLSDDEREQPEMRKHLIRLGVRSGRPRDAVALVEIGSGSEPDPELDLLLAEEFAQVLEEALRGETLNRIKRVLSAEDDALALRAFRLVADLPGHWIEAGLAAQAVDRFALDPELAVPDRLRLAILQIGLQHGKKEEIVDAAVSAYRGSHLGLLATWLLRLGEYERILELTDPSQHEKGLPEMLFFQRTRALEELGHFDELAAELDDLNVPLPPPLQWAMRATVAWKQGEAARGVNMWKQALERADADSSRNYYYRMADLAEGAGEEDLRLEALAMAIEHRLGLPPAARKLQSLFGWLYARGDTARLLRITYRLLRREPANPMLINNYHYLRSLHDTPAAEAEEQLLSLMEASPKQFAYRDSLAVVQLRNGDAEAALATLKGTGMPFAEMGDVAKAVYVAALDAIGQSEEAMTLAGEVEWASLAPQEVAVFKPGQKRTESDLPQVWDKVKDPAKGGKGSELPKIWDKVKDPAQGREGAELPSIKEKTTIPPQSPEE